MEGVWLICRLENGIQEREWLYGRLLGISGLALRPTQKRSEAETGREQDAAKTLVPYPAKAKSRRRKRTGLSRGQVERARESFGSRRVGYRIMEWLFGEDKESR